MAHGVVLPGVALIRVAPDAPVRPERPRENAAERVVLEIHPERRPEERLLARLVVGTVEGRDAHGVHKADLQRVRPALPDGDGRILPARQKPLVRPPVAVRRDVADAEARRIVREQVLVQHQPAAQRIRRRLDLELLDLARHLLLVRAQVRTRRRVCLQPVVLRVLAADKNPKRRNGEEGEVHFHTIIHSYKYTKSAASIDTPMSRNQGRSGGIDFRLETRDANAMRGGDRVRLSLC